MSSESLSLLLSLALLLPLEASESPSCSSLLRSSQSSSASVALRAFLAAAEEAGSPGLFLPISMSAMVAPACRC